MAHHLDLGKTGEDLACAFLQRLGWTVLDRNYRFEKAELDVVALEGYEVVFVEVKTRSGSYFAPPEAAVSAAKQRHLMHAAEAYLWERRMSSLVCRFDVLAITLLPNAEPHILHLRDAFRPGAAAPTLPEPEPEP